MNFLILTLLIKISCSVPPFNFVPLENRHPCYFFEHGAMKDRSLSNYFELWFCEIITANFLSEVELNMI